jgi:tetratricopeptide (TPR) repeat protein
MRKSFRNRITLTLLLLLGFLSLFFGVCWIVYENNSYAVYGTKRPALSGLHSGGYFARAANVLQYYSHDPAQIDHLFKRSIERSPADWNIFLAYFQYLQDRGCCTELATRVLEGVLRRNPSTMRLYVSAVGFFLKTGQKEEALRYFQKAVRMDPRTTRQLVSLAIKNDLSVPELIQITPRTSEGLSVLAVHVSKRGPSYREEWLQIIQELHSLPVEPQQFLISAEQAFRMGEIELGKKYLELALKHPETQARAQKLLFKIRNRERYRSN